jgi:hypothetical protein
MSAIAQAVQSIPSNSALAAVVHAHSDPSCIALRIDTPEGEILVFDSVEGRNSYAKHVATFSDQGEFTEETYNKPTEEMVEVVVAWGRV